MQVSDTNDLRGALLVRVLAVDSRQMEEVVMENFNGDWEARCDWKRFGLITLC